ncbi:DUF2975 domain-containing protein [Alistipes sp.]|uniref:DUF2975 domain-containing protein n=1 Tax=Alistipes sp. TaxID=1872444 RepID=UPI003AF02BDD
MQNKKRLHKHLLIIYIIYFAALLIGFAASFMPGFSRGLRDASTTLAEEQSRGGVRSYYVSASLQHEFSEIEIDGLPDNITPGVEQLNLRVSVPEDYTLGNAFKVVADNGYAYVMMLVMMVSYLAIFILIALIINSLRCSIRDELPIRHANIVRTRWIGALILVAEVSQAVMQFINNREAARLLAGTVYEVSGQFPLNYWNVIVGVLFLFMAEVFAIGTQLSEEQKLTI